MHHIIKRRKCIEINFRNYYKIIERLGYSRLQRLTSNVKMYLQCNRQYNFSFNFFFVLIPTLRQTESRDTSHEKNKSKGKKEKCSKLHLKIDTIDENIV